MKSKEKREAIRELAIGGALLALAGCSSVDYTLARTDYQDCQWLRILALQPTCHEYVGAEHAPPIADVERYCYRSIGGVDCQSEPDPSRTLVGSG